MLVGMIRFLVYIGLFRGVGFGIEFYFCREERSGWKGRFFA